VLGEKAKKIKGQVGTWLEGLLPEVRELISNEIDVCIHGED
jgi:hypothetical protein